MSEGASLHRRRLPGPMGRVASGAAVIVVLVVGGASPAGAEPQRTLSIDPADDVSTSPTATGSFKGASLLVNVEKITAVDLMVSPTGPTGGSPITQDGCAVASAGACNSPQVTFSWAIPALSHNGPYRVEATGRYCDPLLCLSPESASATPIEFRMGAEPQAPTDVRAEPGDTRNVVVSWARNGEPDLLHYAVFRKDPGGDFRRVGSDIKQPASGRPTFTDTSVAGTNGGDFTYRVFAVRNGLSGDGTTTKISKASTDRSASVAPPPTTTVDPRVDPGAPPVTTPGQGVDISSFLSGQDPTLPTPPPIFLDLPDTGFGETLPFGALPDEAEPGEEDAVLPQTPRQREIAEFKRGRPLIPVAAGAVLLVLAGHIRLLNVRTKAAPEKLPAGAYVARALDAARSTQDAARSTQDAARSTQDAARSRQDAARSRKIPVDVATAVASGGHHRVPPVDDVAGLPVWAEFEPVSALGLLDASDYEDELSELELYSLHHSDLEPTAGPDPEPASGQFHEPDPDPELGPELGQFVEPGPGANLEPALHELYDVEAEAGLEHSNGCAPEPDFEHRDAFGPDTGMERELERLVAFEPEREPDPAPEPEPLYGFEPASPQSDLEPEPPYGLEPALPEPDPESDLEPEPLYAFDPAASEPDPEAERLYAFEDEPEWSAEPEVFVSPRR